MRPRRVFTKECKEGAVRLVLDEEKTAWRVAQDLDLTPSALRGWVQPSLTVDRKFLAGMEPKFGPGGV